MFDVICSCWGALNGPTACSVCMFLKNGGSGECLILNVVLVGRKWNALCKVLLLQQILFVRQ